MKNISIQNQYNASRQLNHKIFSSCLPDNFIFNLDLHSNKENLNKKTVVNKEKVFEYKYEKIKMYSDQSLKKQKININRRNWSQILKIKLGIDLEKGFSNQNNKFYPIQHKTPTYQGKSSHNCNQSVKYYKHQYTKANYLLQTIQSSMERVSRLEHFTINLQQLRNKRGKNNHQIMKYPIVNLYKQAKMPVYEISHDNISNILLKDYHQKIGKTIKQKISLESQNIEETKQQSPKFCKHNMNILEGKSLKANCRKAKDHFEKPLQKRKIQSFHKYNKQNHPAHRRQNQPEIEVRPWSFGQIPIDQ